MTPLPSEADLRRQRFDFNPWLFSAESTPGEKEVQAQYQALLHRLYGVKVGPDCFLSTSASITGSPGEALQMGRSGFVAAGAASEPGLQGTEMWLSIIYLMATLTGLAENLSYRPVGVHRLPPTLA